MVREIKFRGKRINKNIWIYGDLVRLEGKTYIFSGDNNDVIDMMNNSFEVIPETVGQYIGHKDKNKKPIYEGDIVKYLYRSEDGTKDEEIEEVKFLSGGFSPFTETYGDSCGTLYQIWNSDYEVIGNIFENPELMEKEK